MRRPAVSACRAGWAWSGDATISGRKLAREHAFVNMMDNADQHGQGLIGITIQRQGRWSSSVMPDVAPFQHRERISSGSPRRAAAEIDLPAPAWVPP